MKDIKNFCRDLMSSYFLDGRLGLNPLSGLVVILFAIIAPFGLLYLKIKSIFIKESR